MRSVAGVVGVAVLLAAAVAPRAADAQAPELPPAAPPAPPSDKPGAEPPNDRTGPPRQGATASERLPRQAETPARTPLPPRAPAKFVPWERHVEIGGDFAFVQRAASKTGDGAATSVRYDPAIGFGLHARWELFEYLRVAIYFLDADHGVYLPRGSLRQDPGSELHGGDPYSVHTFSFGARLSPTLPLTERARAWLSAGIGWGRMEFGRMEITETVVDPATMETTKGTFEVRERADPFVEFPLGIGGSFDIVPRWLSVEVELLGAFVDDQDGDALGEAQAIDSLGRKKAIGGFPKIDASFVQTVGLSLIL